MHKRLRNLACLCAVVLSGTAVWGALAAADSNISGTVPQSYSAGPAVLTSMLVELKPGTAATVVPLTSQDLHRMLGVVVPVNDAAIVLTPQAASSQQVLVAASGNYGLLVSTQNGPIKAGDYLTASAIPGISMKADSDQPEVTGRAAENFTAGSPKSLEKASLKNRLGLTTTVSIGRIAAGVKFAPNPLYQKNSGLNGFLTKSAAGIANKPVSAVKAYLGAIVLLAALVITSTIFYSATRSSMVAIGRNPLARSAISRGLVRNIIVGLLIFGGGVLTAYLVLHS
jgi:hypothetical protein